MMSGGWLPVAGSAEACAAARLPTTAATDRSTALALSPAAAEEGPEAPPEPEAAAGGGGPAGPAPAHRGASGGGEDRMGPGGNGIGRGSGGGGGGDAGPASSAGEHAPPPAISDQPSNPHAPLCLIVEGGRFDRLRSECGCGGAGGGGACRPRLSFPAASWCLVGVVGVEWAWGGGFGVAGLAVGVSGWRVWGLGVRGWGGAIGV